MSRAPHPPQLGPAPGWYAAPDGVVRWWDGQVWGPPQSSTTSTTRGGPPPPGFWLPFAGMGWIMLVALIAIVFAIVAAVRAGQRRPYFYPLSIRLVDRAFLREERARAAG